MSHSEVAQCVPQRANVIELPRRSVHNSSAKSASAERTTHARFLHGRYGDDWLELPSKLGRRLVLAEELLALGPVTLRSTASPAETIRTARLVTGAAAAMAAIAHNEVQILEHALGAHLIDLPLSRLSALADAILGLAAAPTAEPTWSSPAAAQATAAVLDAYDDEIRTGARTHQAVYGHFTEDIWNVPVRRLTTGRRPWRPLAWLRLRRSLAASSRTGSAPKPFAATVELVLEAHAARDALSSVAPLLARLGTYDRNLLTDVDTAKASLAAVQALHVALGDRLDAARVERLLAADAFKNDALLEPARNLVTALRAWTTDVANAGGGLALDTNAADLAQWVTLVDEALPAVEEAIEAVGDRANAPTTMRHLVYDLIVRERFDELSSCASAETIDANVDATQAGAAS